MKPRDAKTSKQLCSLGRDNLASGDYWILVSEFDVHISQQALGEPPQKTISLPKSVFNKLIDFYNREQKPTP